MPCCKAQEYHWCKDLEPVKGYKDDKGNEYCVFHAPQGQKGMSVEYFNSEIFRRLNGALEKGQECDLSGTVFEGEIDFSLLNEKKELPAISFYAATFSEKAKFLGVTFKEALFSMASFKEAEFARVLFTERAEFSRVSFTERANFSGARFNGRADFPEAMFKEAHFNSAEFKEADFRVTTFSEAAYFSKATFSETTDFDRATFTGRATFYGAKFNGEVYFNDETFIGHAAFRNINIKGTVRYEAVNLERVSFTDTDMRMMDFINCKWPKKHGRDVLYDELELFKPEFEMPRWRKLKARFFPDKEKVKKVEILYRRLKQKYKDEHDDPGVSPWHYGEKEMFRKGSLFRRYFPLSFSNLYWLSSGYGERPARAGAALLLLILAATLLLAMSGLEVSNGADIKVIHGVTNEMLSKGLDVKTLWPLLLNTLKFATFQKDPFFVPKGWIGETVKIFAQILIPIQAALLALAVRNRFRR